MAKSKVKISKSPTAEQFVVKSLGKALKILDTVAEAEHPLMLSEIALQADLPRPTAHRIVQTLI